MIEPEDQGWPNRFPWGAVVAAIIIWAVDSLALGPHGPWDVFTDLMPDDHPMERGVVADRVETALVLDEDDGKPLVAVMGSSRAHAGIHLHLMGRELPDVELLGVAHAGMNPYEIRGALDSLLPLGPELVVILISEFDTHRPLRLMPQTAPGSFGALSELAAFVGVPFVWEHRTTFLQVALASVLNSYRYREVFAVAGLEDYRMFVHPKAPRGQGVMQIPFLLEGEPPLPLDVSKAMDELAVVYPHLSARARAAGLSQCRSITRGPHALAQMELIAHTVREIRENGGRVLLVEGPLAPATTGFYDLTIRAEFLELVARLCEDEGVSFLPLDESGPFPQELFADLTHLAKEGAKQMSAAVGQRVAVLLEVSQD